jgi:hypothetical protein
MPRGKPGELAEFVPASRRHARRHAFHDEKTARLRDADADALDAKPAKVPARLPDDDAQTLTIAERALVARLNRELRLDLMALRRAPQNAPDASPFGRLRGTSPAGHRPGRAC